MMTSYVVPIPLWNNKYAISSEGVCYKMPESKRLLTFIDTEGNKYVRIFHHEGYNFTYDTYLVSDLLDLITEVNTAHPKPVPDHIDRDLLMVERELHWRSYHYPPMQLKWLRHNDEDYLSTLNKRQRRALYRALNNKFIKDPMYISKEERERLKIAGLSTLATDPMVSYNDPLCQVIQFNRTFCTEKLLKVA
ncbi:hypothetical protein [Vibrio owensii]|uniref:hypothetical protein n=1 Tax=Vibrio owensii TaxID=696485 RepID=UPI004068A4F8